MLTREYITARLKDFIDMPSFRTFGIDGKELVSISDIIIDKTEMVFDNIFDYLTEDIKANLGIYPIPSDGVQIEITLINDKTLIETYYEIDIMEEYIEILICDYNDLNAKDYEIYNKTMFYDNFSIDEILNSLEIIEPSIKIRRRKEKIMKIIGD